MIQNANTTQRNYKYMPGKIIRICCVCKKSLGPDMPRPLGFEGDIISHGYCSEHEALANAELDALLAKEKAGKGKNNE